MFGQCTVYGVTNKGPSDDPSVDPEDPNYHALRASLTLAANSVESDNLDDVVEAMLGALNDARLISYAPVDVLKLLTPAGRALMVLMEKPDLTQRELAVVLGISEGTATTTVSALVQANLLVRTKVSRKNHYRFDPEALCKHPDISRFLAAITPVVGGAGAL